MMVNALEPVIKSTVTVRSCRSAVLPSALNTTGLLVMESVTSAGATALIASPLPGCTTPLVNAPVVQSVARWFST